MAYLIDAGEVVGKESIFTLCDQPALIDMRSVVSVKQEAVERIKDLLNGSSIQIYTQTPDELINEFRKHEFRAKFLELDELDLYELVEA